jgi:hypothetical protein
MPAATRQKCVLWDFGDTLADERWMEKSFQGVPDWSRVWSQVVSGELGDQWSLGQLDTSAVVTAVATRLAVAPESVFEHIRCCCSSIHFFETPLKIARRSSLPQAIVTVNPDAFSKLIVPQHELDQIFSPIVTSWQERTLDKGLLGLIAVERFGLGIGPSEALLIDNKI